MILLRVLFIAQLVLMLPAFAFLLLTPVHLGTVAVVRYLAPFGLSAALFASWQLIKHADRRSLAAATAATPFLCLAAPFAINSLNGGPVGPAVPIIALIALIVAAALVLLSNTGRWRGCGLFANRRFNLAIFVALGVLFLLLWFPIIAWFASEQSYLLPSNLIDRDNVVQAGVIYCIAIAVPGLCLSLFALLYAPVGLLRNPGARVVHFGQFVMALLLLASLIFVAFGIYVGMVIDRY
jgi:hypothetical protein